MEKNRGEEKASWERPAVNLPALVLMVRGTRERYPAGASCDRTLKSLESCYLISWME